MYCILDVHKLTETSILPYRKHARDAGFDVYADEDVEIEIGEVARVKTGIAIHPWPAQFLPNLTDKVLPVERGVTGYGETWTYACFAWDKSGRGSDGIKVLGGVIDDPYTGEVEIILTFLHTFTLFDWLRQHAGIRIPRIRYTIRRGEKLCNLIVQRVELPYVRVVDSMTETDRGAGGFGSTGAR